MCHIHMSKKAAWLRELSDGSRAEPEELFINREPQHGGFAEIPFVAAELAEHLLYN